MKAHMEDSIVAYNELSALLNRLKYLNPNMTIALQLDCEDCFYHLLIGYPDCIEKHGELTYNFLQTDGFHFKNPEYDGVCIVYFTKTGFGTNLIMAFAIVPRESQEHLAWSLQMLWRCSPTMTNPQIIFTNHGHLLSAVRSIYQELGIVVPLNYCDRHFVRNIAHQFQIKKDFRKTLSKHIQS